MKTPSNLLANLAFGIIGGMRSMSGPAATTLAISRGALQVAGTPLAFLGSKSAPWIFGALAVGELVADKLPFIPDRKSPPAFTARIVSGALSGAACMAENDEPIVGAVTGALAAVAGTLGGSALRSSLAEAFGHDLPAAVLEDAIVLSLAALAFATLGQSQSEADKSLTSASL